MGKTYTEFGNASYKMNTMNLKRQFSPFVRGFSKMKEKDT